MRRRDPFDVVVVGAGVVGSATALACAREGLRVAVVEPRVPAAWHADAQDLRVFALAQDGIDLLDDLDVWGAIAPHAQPYRSMRVWDAAGGGELCFEAQRYGRDALGWIAEGALLADRLWSALQLAGVTLRCPQAVVGIDGDGVESGDGSAVALRLDDHSTLRARLVIAADGADSKLRDMAGIALVRHDYGQRGLVAFVQTEMAHADTAWQRFLPTGPLAFLPFRDGRSSIVWTLPDAEAARLLAVDDATFCAELTRAFDATLGEVVAVSQRAAFPLRRQLAERFVAGRIVLCGDAAHAVHPLAGQGLNVGLRDVIALRKMLRAARMRGADIGAPHRLARWGRERRSESAVAAWTFDGINRLFSTDAPLPTLLRGHLLGLGGRVPGMDGLLWKRAAGV
ncbi:MAG: FAD-dependent oxidoreductase [Proteobacteria bacterium]|nr:FAD-dependent oxidoreductase [Pseudomonadota bacterium]